MVDFEEALHRVRTNHSSYETLRCCDISPLWSSAQKSAVVEAAAANEVTKKLIVSFQSGIAHVLELIMPLIRLDKITEVTLYPDRMPEDIIR
jgi:hypothetical protein